MPKEETPEVLAKRKKALFEKQVKQWSAALKEDEARVRTLSRDLKATNQKHLEGHLGAMASEATNLRDSWMELERLFENNASQSEIADFMRGALKVVKDAREDMDSAEKRINPHKKFSGKPNAKDQLAEANAMANIAKITAPYVITTPDYFNHGNANTCSTKQQNKHIYKLIGII